jgi:hypothetical protein
MEETLRTFRLIRLENVEDRSIAMYGHLSSAGHILLRNGCHAVTVSHDRIRLNSDGSVWQIEFER